MSTSPTEQVSIDESLLAEFDASGESAAGFARARGLAPWRIYYALNRRAGKARRGRPPSRSAAPKMIPVRVVPESQTISVLELELAGGHRLRISRDFDPELLRRVLGALARC